MRQYKRELKPSTAFGFSSVSDNQLMSLFVCSALSQSVLLSFWRGLRPVSVFRFIITCTGRPPRPSVSQKYSLRTFGTVTLLSLPILLHALKSDGMCNCVLYKITRYCQRNSTAANSAIPKTPEAIVTKIGVSDEVGDPVHFITTRSTVFALHERRN